MQKAEHSDPGEKRVIFELLPASPARSKHEVEHSSKPTTLDRDTYSRRFESLLGRLFESS